jgi:hypothetical protein
MSDKKDLCSGCYNDCYNHGTGGATECFSLKTAKRVKRVRVGTWQEPPYRWRPVETLTCFHVEGSSFLNRDDCRVVDDSDAAVEKWRNNVD